MSSKLQLNNFVTLFKNGIFTIKFNRIAKRNAINPETMIEFKKVLEHATSNEEIDFVVLTGEGQFYSSGMDMTDAVSSMESNAPKYSISDMMTIGRDFVASFINFPKLLIAVVNGPAIGIAFTTLALCDIVYCSSNAYFWAPFTRHGLNAEGCSSYLFPKAMGNVKANEVLQFGKKLTPSEAKELNLVTNVFKPEELNTVVWPMIYKLHDDLASKSVITNKKLTRILERPLLHKINEAEWEALEERVASEDFMKSVIKFVNRKHSLSKL